MKIVLSVLETLPNLNLDKCFRSSKCVVVRSCVNCWFSKQINIMGAKLSTVSKCCLPLKKKEKTPLLITDKLVEESVCHASLPDHTTPSCSKFTTMNNEENVIRGSENAQNGCLETCSAQVCETQCLKNENKEYDAVVEDDSNSKTITASKRPLLPSSEVSKDIQNLKEENCLDVVSEPPAPGVSPRKKRRKNKHTSEVIKCEVGIKEKKATPNYFVAFKVSDPEIHHKLDVVQQHVIEQDSRLKKCLIKLPSLHITLMVMHLENDDQHARALNALKMIHSAYNENMSKNPLELEFKGLGHFSNKVLFANISSGDSLDRLSLFANDVNKYFQEACIYSTDEDRDFNPHLTIMKLSKDPSLRRKNVRKISPSLYSLYQDTFFGKQVVQGIELLSMSHPVDETGYYFGTKLFFDIPVGI